MGFDPFKADFPLAYHGAWFCLLIHCRKNREKHRQSDGFISCKAGKGRGEVSCWQNSYTLNLSNKNEIRIWAPVPPYWIIKVFDNFSMERHKWAFLHRK